MFRAKNRHILFFLSLLVPLGIYGCDDDDPTGLTDPPVPEGESVVLQWNDVNLQAIRDTKPGPPQTARALAIVHTAMYDAWAAYDAVAVGTRYGGDLRRPSEEHTPGRKSEAISYAAYRALTDQYPSQEGVFRAKMTALGYDPDNDSTDRTTPAGIGNVAAAAVIAFRHVDGANQTGELGNGAPYSDYTGYAPMNPPISVESPSVPEDFPHPDRWQPLTFVNPAGATVTPAFICPQWGHVVPFAMTSPSMFRPVPPAPLGSPEYLEQAQELITLSANLTDEQKWIAEYWADGPSSELPPGHFNLFAHMISERDGHTLDQDMKMFFALTNAVFDVGIAVWEAKAYYDYCRPVTAIRYLFGGQTINAWGGPGQNNVPIDGAAWKPYQPTWFPTPPFAEYPSGHSGFSAAAAEVLKRVTGSDSFTFSYTVQAGGFKAEPGVAPASAVTVTFNTFSEAADEAGISRQYGGIHFEQGDMASRTMGRQCGALAWEKAKSYWEGTAGSLALPGEELAAR
jgi:hypothetical protein